MTTAPQRPSILKFTFGPFLVARHKILLRVVDVAANPERALAPGAEPDMSKLASEEQGFLFRSQPIPNALPRYTLGDAAVRYVPQQYDRCYIDLTIGYEEYLSRFSSKARSDRRRKVRKFSELPGGMEFRTCRAPDELREFHKAARRISVQTYQERLYDAGLPDSDGFKAEMARLAASDGVRGYLLLVGGEPVSYLYCPIDRGRMQYSVLGFSPGFAQHSPGTVLLWLALEEIFNERRFTRFDFLEGESQQKRLFSTHAVPSANIYFLRRTVSMRGLVQLHARLEALGDHVVNLVDRTGFRARLRRIIRRS